MWGWPVSRSGTRRPTRACRSWPRAITSCAATRAWTLRRRDGALVQVLPMALTTAIEEGAGLHLFQLVRLSDRELAIRLPEGPSRARQASCRAARTALAPLLAAHGLDDVAVALDPLPPRVSASSGKLHQVISQARRPGAAPPRAGRSRAAEAS